nr:DNA repair protein RAD16-like [Ipomoea batatas]
MDTGFKEEKQQNEEVVDGSKFGVGGPHTTSPEFIALINRINERKKKRIKKRKDRPILMWEVWDDENDQWLVENFTTDVEIDNRNEVMSETAEAPSELIMPLLRYQKEWLAWALKQEESASKGGILADEMGMGKTVQAIALVLAKRELKRAIGEHCLPSSSPSTSQGLPAMKGTLVICPVVAVGQWVSEIERFTLKGSNKVLVYHGKNREKCLDRLSEYDFVITTYSIVEFDYRKICDASKAEMRVQVISGKSILHSYIASPIQAEGHYGNGRDAMILLKNKILKSVLLRRTKKGRAADLALPPRIVS